MSDYYSDHYHPLEPCWRTLMRDPRVWHLLRDGEGTCQLCRRSLTPIEATSLARGAVSTRAYNAIRRADVTGAEELVLWTERALLGLPNVGEKLVEEIMLWQEKARPFIQLGLTP